MRFNPTRRGDIGLPGHCKCGWARKLKRYVNNGCLIHGIKCPKCDGYGENGSGKKCTDCNGTGKR